MQKSIIEETLKVSTHFYNCFNGIIVLLNQIQFLPQYRSLNCFQGKRTFFQSRMKSLQRREGTLGFGLLEKQWILSKIRCPELRPTSLKVVSQNHLTVEARQKFSIIGNIQLALMNLIVETKMQVALFPKWNHIFKDSDYWAERY